MGHVVVDTTSDVADAPDTSSITALLTNRGNDDLVSLREAILATNDSPNLGIPDQIYFNIPDIDPGHVYYRDDSTASSLSLVVPNPAGRCLHHRLRPGLSRPWAQLVQHPAHI